MIIINDEKLHGKEASIEIATKFDLTKTKKIYAFVGCNGFVDSKENKITIASEKDHQGYLSGEQIQFHAGTLTDIRAVFSYLSDYIEVEIINPKDLDRIYDVVVN